MVAYSFKRRFVRPVWTGDKPHTIRADRRRHALPGEMVSLYYAQRTSQCRLIMRAPCTSVSPITIERGIRPSITVGGETLPAGALDAFARSDGFQDLADMLAFWDEEHPEVSTFSGWIIKWDPSQAVDRLVDLTWLESGPTTNVTPEWIVRTISRLRCDLTDEKRCQGDIAAGLTTDGIAFEREKVLGPGERPDFMIGGTAVEVKMNRAAPRQIFRQLERYAKHESVKAIVLVTNRAMGLPHAIGGKPAYYVSLGRAWL
jgi:hypothetical protein